MPSIFNNATLSVGSQPEAILDPPPGVCGMNRFSIFTGGTRSGLGEFLMLAKDFNRLMVAQPANAKGTLSISGAPGPGIDLPVYIIGAVPLSLTIGDNRNQDIVKVVLRDARFIQQMPLNKGYNVQKQTFPMSGASPVAAEFYTTTLKSGTDIWTWEQLLLDAVNLMLPTALTAWKPRNIIFDNIPPGKAHDVLAAQLYMVAGYDWKTDTPSLKTPGVFTQDNSDLLDQADEFATAGGYSFRNSKRLPGSYLVTFKAYDLDNLDDPFKQRLYQKSVSTATGNADFTPVLHVGSYVAIYSGAAWKNQTELDAVATDIAARALAFASQDIAQKEFPGIWPFQLDGAIRGIQWITDDKGARTIISLNNDMDFNPLSDLRRSIEVATNTFIVPLGGSNCGMDNGTGARYIWSDSLTEVITARLGASTGDRYSWTQVRYKSDDTYENVPGGLTGSMSDSSGFALDMSLRANAFAAGTVVCLHRGVLNTSGQFTLIWEIIGSTVLFAVSVTQSAGSDGTSSATASWTYNVTGVPGGPYSPVMQRPKGTTLKATHGLGYYASGSFTLFWVDECCDTTECSG